MFEELKKVLDEREKTVDKEAVINDIVPAEVILKVDENGNATIKVDGRNKEIFGLVGDMIVKLTKGDDIKTRAAISAIRSRITFNFLANALKKSEDGE
jgi:hypothetical protein